MSNLEIIRSVLINIAENKVKVLLTMLGIIVGTVTVVIVLAVGRGSQADVDAQYENLNVGTLQVMSGFGRNVTNKITTDIADQIRETGDHIQYVSMVLSAQSAVSYQNTSNTLSVIGASEALQSIINLEMYNGRFITEDDNDLKNRVAVIGMTFAETYFEEDVDSAIGKSLSIGGRKYEIVGIIDLQGDSTLRGLNVDESVLIPYNVSEKYLTGRMTNPNLLALSTDVDSVDEATTEIQTVLDDEFGRDSEEFTIANSGSKIEAAKESAQTVTVMLLVVAVVVLIVGGIGIMNVLFVSVKERTREIGILKAIGARRKDILKIFLYEAFLISILGGVIGALLSLVSLPIFEYFGVTMLVSPIDMLISIGFSVTIGTFFGLYPAAKAAALKPIDALNYE